MNISNPFSENIFNTQVPLVDYKMQLKNQGMETDFHVEFGTGFKPGSPEPTPQSPRYLTFTANEDNCTIAMGADVDPNAEDYVPFTYNMEYSLDNGETWNPYEVYIEGWESPKNVSSENEGGRREGKAEAGKENEENDGEDTQTNEPYLIELAPNESVLFRGHNATLSYGTIEEKEPVIIQGFYFQTDGKGYFTASGDVTSLLNGIGGNVALTTTLEMSYLFGGCRNLATVPSLPSTTLAPYCYYQMFNDCNGLTSAPALPATTLAEGCYYCMFQNCNGLTTAPELPATTLANYCYYQMFYGSKLTTAPALPATTLANYCYHSMFRGCTGLTTAPALPATTLASGCYAYMFYGCTGLTVAPELPATTLASGCYSYMFNYCSSLSSITCLATDITASSCTTSWVYGVSNSGTFTKAASMNDWIRDVDGIPVKWTVIDA